MSLLSLPAHLSYYLYTGHADMRRTFEACAGWCVMKWKQTR